MTGGRGVAKTRRTRRWVPSRARRAGIGLWSGWALLVAGVFLAFGPGAALIVAGVLVAGTFLLLYDVDEPTIAKEAR